MTVRVTSGMTRSYRPADGTEQGYRLGLRPTKPLLAEVLAAEDVADGGVLEDGVDRPGEDAGDGQHLELVDLLLRGDRDRVGHDHARELAVLQAIRGWVRQQGMGGHAPDVGGALLLEDVGRRADRAARVDHVIDHDAG